MWFSSSVSDDLKTIEKTPKNFLIFFFSQPKHRIGQLQSKKKKKKKKDQPGKKQRENDRGQYKIKSKKNHTKNKPVECLQSRLEKE